MLSEIKDMKRIECMTSYFVLTPRLCPRCGTWGAGVPRGSTLYFFEHGYVAYQLDGNEKKRMQV